MKSVQPEVFLVSRPQLDYQAMAAYLTGVGGDGWLERLDRGEFDDAQNLVEFAGKLCYRAWEPGLNRTSSGFAMITRPTLRTSCGSCTDLCSSTPCSASCCMTSAGS